MDSKENEYIPRANVRKFVHALLSEAVMGNKTKAEKVSGVLKERFYYHYRTDPLFRKWYSDQCDHFLGMNEHLPALSLLKKVSQGNVSAIRTYYELKDKLKVHSNAVEVNNNTTVNVQKERVYVFSANRSEIEDHQKENPDLYAGEGAECNRIREAV